MKAHEVLVNKKPYWVRVLERNGDAFLVEVNEKTVRARIKNLNQGETAIIEINGESFQVHVKRVRRGALQVKIGGKLFEVQHQPRVPLEPAVRPGPATTITGRPAISVSIERGAVTAPIAGKIVLLRVSVGQKVEKGESICVLEAMKMENEIAAPRAGTVKEIRVSEGDIVNKGDVLVVIT